MTMFTKAYLLDMAERVLRGFLVAFLTALVAGPAIPALPNLSVLQAAGWAGIHGAGVILLGLLTSGVGDNRTASVLPDPPADD